jgi:hypothetical protein
MSLSESGVPDVITDHYGPALAQLPDGKFYRVGIFGRLTDMKPVYSEITKVSVEDITIV